MSYQWVLSIRERYKTTDKQYWPRKVLCGLLTRHSFFRFLFICCPRTLALWCTYEVMDLQFACFWRGAIVVRVKAIISHTETNPKLEFYLFIFKKKSIQAIILNRSKRFQNVVQFTLNTVNRWLYVRVENFFNYKLLICNYEGLISMDSKFFGVSNIICLYVL